MKKTNALERNLPIIRYRKEDLRLNKISILGVGIRR